MNENRAKYILYLPRSKDGRGLKCFETTYKEIKIKTAMKLITETEPCITCVNLLTIKPSLKSKYESYRMNL